MLALGNGRRRVYHDSRRAGRPGWLHRCPGSPAGRRPEISGSHSGAVVLHADRPGTNSTCGDTLSTRAWLGRPGAFLHPLVLSTSPGTTPPAVTRAKDRARAARRQFPSSPWTALPFFLGRPRLLSLHISASRRPAACRYVRAFGLGAPRCRGTRAVDLLRCRRCDAAPRRVDPTRRACRLRGTPSLAQSRLKDPRHGSERPLRRRTPIASAIAGERDDRF